MQATYSGADKRLQYLFQNAKSVSVSQTLQSGTEVAEVTIDGVATKLYAPSGGGGGSTVTVTPIVTTGTKIATIGVDQNSYDLYAPSGGGNVADVYVNGSSVLDANHIAQIDLSGYATDSELSSAVAALQSSFQDGVDRIYEACVRKGSTPASHSLSDVIAAIYAISGTTPIVYEEVDSEVTVIPEFITTVEVN